MLTVRPGPLTFAVRETGSGDPVFLINGTGESGATWAALTDRLGTDWRCLAIDNRDTGGSSLSSGRYTPADMALDAAGVLDHLAVGPCHVIGFSLGGAVAQELALARPDLVRSLGLLSTWARSDAWFIAQMRSWQALRGAFPDDEQAFDAALEPWMFSPATMADPLVLDAIHQMWSDAPPQSADAFVRQCDADIAHDALDRLPSVNVPALVVVGEDDICTPPRYAAELAAALPRAELSIVRDAGHCAIFEKPDEVAGLVAGFLSRIGSGLSSEG